MRFKSKLFSICLNLRWIFNYDINSKSEVREGDTMQLLTISEASLTQEKKSRFRVRNTLLSGGTLNPENIFV